jgi:ketosteroid isomerase-like protein
MKPRELIQSWVAHFNTQNLDGLMSLYHENAINHQTQQD